ncbi:response regulator transcription factor [Nioella nitratireducens]|uniref:response regulator transcription factor n=1 Tax=Nioella nitratireducens TaxID=1287720 RepID=UPI0008FD0CDB|nr:response regulator transcription factor [Nioella nitratireducens]
MATKTTILVVEDEAEVRAVLRTGLEAEGCQVVEAVDRNTMMAAVEAQPIDLVTLDLRLGQEDGLNLATELRARKNIPILVITGLGDPFDRVRGLERGADDYIVKPFHIREVVLRIRHVLSRYQTEVSDDRTVTFDHSAFDLKRKTVQHLDGSEIKLTGIEQRILELFVRHPGRVLSRDDICQALHGRDWTPYDRTIDGHVARLRRKIEPPGEAPALIRSVRGVGYVFTADVTSGSAGPA